MDMAFFWVIFGLQGLKNSAETSEDYSSNAFGLLKGRKRFGQRQIKKIEKVGSVAV